MRDNTKAELQNLVSLAALQIDGDLHDTLKKPEQESSDTYLKLKATLKRIKAASTGISFIYTARLKTDGQIEFVVDAEENPEKLSHIGDIYPEASDILKNMTTGAIKTPTTENDFYTDKWGTWLSGYAPLYARDGRLVAVIGADISATKIVTSERSSLLSAIFVLIFSIIIAVFSSWWLARTITAPLSAMIEFSNRIAAGDFSSKTDNKLIRANDEFGELYHAMLTMRDKIVAVQRQIQEKITFLNQILQKISVISADLGRHSQKVAQTSQTLSQSATEQAASLNQISSSMNEIQNRTRDNEKSSESVSNLASESNEAALQGKKQIETTLSAMMDIQSSSEQIAKIMRVIDDIAFQTNLLALNAAVEAARAGQHGKGFSVVAEEVRRLAGRCADAAHETADLISNSRKGVENGLTVTHSTVDVFEGIVKKVEKLSEIATQIVEASHAQTTGISGVASAVAQLNRVTQQNLTIAEDSAKSAIQISDQSDTLSGVLKDYSSAEASPQ